MEKPKKRWGDRRDGVWLRNLDPMHAFVPYLYPNRADNEAFIAETLDLTALDSYLAKKNEGLENDHYTLFQALIAAIVKVVVLRPKMNRFIQGRRMYERRDVSVSFVVKKQFSDEAHEGLALLHFDGDSTIESVHAALLKEIHTRRGAGEDPSTGFMGILAKLPRPIMRFLMWILNRLDFYGRVPAFLLESDPNQATVFLTNLGSIHLKAGYHHLTNWGTNSLFITVGEKYKAPFYREDGTYEMKTALDIGLTLDERIADGYYYSGTVRLLKDLLANPELLEKPAKEPVKL